MPNTTTRNAKPTTCELCGRRVDTGNAKIVPVIGPVGPTCYHRVSAVEEVLTQNGLEPLLSGPVRITLDDIRAGNDPLPRNARQLAYKLGLLLNSRTEEDAEGTITAATFWLTIRSGKTLRRVLTA
ncbi:MAG: hypothetical protein U5L04_09785 [Trueperaceae bacterium]|nr:hypothetical protein [Trueperaceae bacterium]